MCQRRSSGRTPVTYVFFASTPPERNAENADFRNIKWASLNPKFSYTCTVLLWGRLSNQVVASRKRVQVCGIQLLVRCLEEHLSAENIHCNTSCCLRPFFKFYHNKKFGQATFFFSQTNFIGSKHFCILFIASLFQKKKMEHTATKFWFYSNFIKEWNNFILQ